MRKHESSGYQNSLQGWMQTLAIDLSGDALGKQLKRYWKGWLFEHKLKFQPF
jgi:hypothetical protein